MFNVSININEIYCRNSEIEIRFLMKTYVIEINNE